MIRVPEVRLVGVEGEPLGIVGSDQARTMAREAELDLVEISPTANPPVCRIMDYGKFKYEQKKKASESKKKQHTMTVKEVRVRPKTGQHDIDVKVKRAREFLEEGDKVQLTVLFKGREVVHSHIGIAILNEIAKTLTEVAKVERPPRLEGKRMHMILSPIKR
jgi:translation initiation factor IF-3